MSVQPRPSSPSPWSGASSSPVPGASSPRPLARIPRAHVDPITGPADALAVISLAITQPLADETVVVVLDERRRGSVVTVVSGTCGRDLALILERFCRAAVDAGAASLVVATVRPRGATRPGDVDRWLEASALVESFGLALLEWFVIGPAGPECPRDLIGEPERW